MKIQPVSSYFGFLTVFTPTVFSPTSLSLSLSLEKLSISYNLKRNRMLFFVRIPDTHVPPSPSNIRKRRVYRVGVCVEAILYFLCSKKLKSWREEKIKSFIGLIKNLIWNTPKFGVFFQKFLKFDSKKWFWNCWIFPREERKRERNKYRFPLRILCLFSFWSFWNNCVRV